MRYPIVSKDIRFRISRESDGSDVIHKDPDSCATFSDDLYLSYPLQSFTNKFINALKKMNLKSSFFPGICLFIICCSHSTAQQKSIALFNQKDLSNWDTYIGPGLDPEGKHRADLPAPGLNQDPFKVFTVVEVDGGPAIRISGERFGGLSTKAEYGNYHLSFKFKWGKLKWVPKDKAKMDSGILYHAVGPHGVDWGFWMRSQEFQVQEGDCGDYWGLDGASFDIPASKNIKGEYQYEPYAPIRIFNNDNTIGRHCIKGMDGELPTGQWNTAELYCHHDTAVHIINGHTNMVLYRSRHIKNGQESPLTRGKIQIQSEGAEIFYKDIVLTPIRQIPVAALPSNK